MKIFIHFWGVIFWVGIIKVKVYLNYQRFKQIISGVSIYASCWQIFHTFTILPVASMYILEIVCCIRKYKETLRKMYKFLNKMHRKHFIFYVNFCNKNHSKKSQVKMGLRLHYMVPDHIKKFDTNEPFLKGSSKYFFYNTHFIQWMNIATYYITLFTLYSNDRASLNSK